MALINYMRTIAILSRILIGLFFILSGWIKLYPIEYFENDLLFHNISSDEFVVFIARFLVSLEIIIGALFCLFIYKKWTDILAIIMLLIYSTWLITILVINGNEGNCGCMGNWIELTPLEGLMKNVLMLGLIVLFFKRPSLELKFRPMLFLLVAIIMGLTVPYIVAPPIFTEASYGDPTKSYFPQYSLITQDSLILKNLSEDKKIVAFFLSNCEHCQLAATRLQAIYQNQTDFPIHAFIYGDSINVQNFIHETRMTFSYSSVADLSPVIKVAGNDFPTIQLIENGEMKQFRSLYDINKKELNDWLNKTE